MIISDVFRMKECISLIRIIMSYKNLTSLVYLVIYSVVKLVQLVVNTGVSCRKSVTAAQGIMS
jgi:hypothetical protein